METHRKSGTSDQGKGSGYIGAPYNFIDFPSCWVARYDEFGQLPRHDRFVEGTLSGQIVLEWVAQTPIFVKQGGLKKGEDARFFRNHEGFAIPGSSLRGLTRSHVQILGMGNYRDDIQNDRFMHRGMASMNEELREQYESSIGIASDRKLDQQRKKRGMLPDKLKAGYVYKHAEGKYYIIPAKMDDKGKQFYYISEHRLHNMNLSDKRVRYMYTENIWKNYRPKQVLGNNDKSGNYSPYYTQIHFSMSLDGITVHKITLPDPQQVNSGFQAGYLLSSGYMNNKKAHYVVREAGHEQTAIPIHEDLVDQYNMDLIRSKLKGGRERDEKNRYYHLPEGNERKPIFYVEVDGKIRYFGFTPFLRVFYDYGVHDGIPQPFREGWKLDYSKSLFGFIAAKQHGIQQSYKSRLSFGDLQATGKPHEVDPVSVLLGEPKATAYPLYLKQPKAGEDGTLHTYNTNGFQIRGMKRYWRKPVTQPQSGNNQNMITKMRPLDKGTEFKGTIRFTNLAPDELGLLLWSLMLHPGSTIQMGMGKPYGYGQLKLKRDAVKLYIENISQKYCDRFTFTDECVDEVEPEHYVEAYQEHMCRVYGIDIVREAHVQEFLRMTQHEMKIESSRYMKIGKRENNEYGSLDPLPTVEEAIEGKVVRRVRRKK